MMNLRYILGNDKIPIIEPDLLKWAEWLEKSDRHIGNDMIGEIHISTVFLGLDHSFGNQIPILFETMIFGGINDEYCCRYSTWEEAEYGHNIALNAVMNNIKL